MANTVERTDQEGLVGQAQAQETASTAQERAVTLKEQGKSKLGEALDQRTNDAGGQARKIAQALRRSGEQLSNEGDADEVAGVTEGAADRIERLGATSSGRAALSWCATSRTSREGVRGWSRAWGLPLRGS